MMTSTFISLDKETKNQIGIDVAELFVLSGLVKSKNEARNQIKNGGIRVHDVKIKDPFARVTLNNNQLVIIEKVADNEQ